MVQRPVGGIDAISLRVPPFDGDIALPERPLLQIEAAAGFLEGGRTQADLSRGVLEREVEEALERLVADANMAGAIRILSFLAASQEYARRFPFRHVRRRERSGQAAAGRSDLNATRAGDRRPGSVSDGGKCEDRRTRGAALRMNRSNRCRLTPVNIFRQHLMRMIDGSKNEIRQSQAIY